MTSPVSSTLMALVALGCTAFAAPASAAILLDYSGGTVVASPTTGPGNKDDGVIFSSHNLQGDFFGEELFIPFPTISINGHIYFGNGDGEGDYLLRPLGDTPPFGPSGITRIAPMWADFNLGTNGRIIEDSGSGYYAVTWLNMETSLHPGYFANFQAIFIESATTLAGINFNAGDIVFSYGDIGIYQEILEVIVGLEESSGGVAAIPGHQGEGGWHSHATTGDFGVGSDEYVLFRPDGAGAYNSSIVQVPEPSALAVAAGAVLLAGLRRKRTESV